MNAFEIRQQFRLDPPKPKPEPEGAAKWYRDIEDYVPLMIDFPEATIQVVAELAAQICELKELMAGYRRPQ